MSSADNKNEQPKLGNVEGICPLKLFPGHVENITRVVNKKYCVTWNSSKQVSIVTILYLSKVVANCVESMGESGFNYMVFHSLLHPDTLAPSVSHVAQKIVFI